MATATHISAEAGLRMCVCACMLVCVYIGLLHVCVRRKYLELRFASYRLSFIFVLATLLSALEFQTHTERDRKRGRVRESKREREIQTVGGTLQMLMKILWKASWVWGRVEAERCGKLTNAAQRQTDMGSSSYPSTREYPRLHECAREYPQLLLVCFTCKKDQWQFIVMTV